MVVEKLLQLPMEVEFEEIVFHLTVFKNGESEMRLCYDVLYVKESSKHHLSWMIDGCFVAPAIFGDERPCSFLFLVENISTDEKMVEAVDDALAFLEQHKDLIEV